MIKLHFALIDFYELSTMVRSEPSDQSLQYSNIDVRCYNTSKIERQCPCCNVRSIYTECVDCCVGYHAGYDTMCRSKENNEDQRQPDMRISSKLDATGELIVNGLDRNCYNSETMDVHTCNNTTEDILGCRMDSRMSKGNSLCSSCANLLACRPCSVWSEHQELCVDINKPNSLPNTMEMQAIRLFKRQFSLHQKHLQPIAPVSHQFGLGSSCNGLTLSALLALDLSVNQDGIAANCSPHQTEIDSFIAQSTDPSRHLLPIKHVDQPSQSNRQPNHGMHRLDHGMHQHGQDVGFKQVGHIDLGQPTDQLNQSIELRNQDMHRTNLDTAQLNQVMHQLNMVSKQLHFSSDRLMGADDVLKQTTNQLNQAFNQPIQMSDQPHHATIQQTNQLFDRSNQVTHITSPPNLALSRHFSEAPSEYQISRRASTARGISTAQEIPTTSETAPLSATTDKCYHHSQTANLAQKTTFSGQTSPQSTLTAVLKILRVALLLFVLEGIATIEGQMTGYNYRSALSWKSCKSTDDCKSTIGQVCWWAWDGCDAGECMCDPRTSFHDASTGFCRKLKYGGERCEPGDKCFQGMVCEENRCQCVKGSMTSDKMFCLLSNERLLGQQCTKKDTCYQRAKHGYTKSETHCGSNGRCQCDEGFKEDGWTCRKWNVNEPGCSKDHHCQGGALCVDSVCRCPSSYIPVAQDSKCAKHGALLDRQLRQSCDEINEYKYCAYGLVCHQCAGSQKHTCVKFIEAEALPFRYSSSASEQRQTIVSVLLSLTFTFLWTRS